MGAGFVGWCHEAVFQEMVGPVIGLRRLHLACLLSWLKLLLGHCCLKIDLGYSLCAAAYSLEVADQSSVLPLWAQERIGGAVPLVVNERGNLPPICIDFVVEGSLRLQLAMRVDEKVLLVLGPVVRSLGLSLKGPLLKGACLRLLAFHRSQICD